MQPISLSVQIWVKSQIVFSGRKYRSRSIVGPTPYFFETMVHGLQRITYSKGEVNESMVRVLAFIPPPTRVHISKSDKGWVSEELCWVTASIKSNSKGRDSHVLAAFIESGDLEWLVEEKA